eukprot:11858485-Karenia_brevis.AAC.1
MMMMMMMINNGVPTHANPSGSAHRAYVGNTVQARASSKRSAITGANAAEQFRTKAHECDTVDREI